MEYTGLAFLLLASISIAHSTPLTMEELEEIRSQCPRLNGKHPVYIPHPADCTEFFMCDNGRPKAVKCPSSLHFNTRSNVCDFQERAGCTVSEDITLRRRPVIGGKRPLMKRDSRCPLRNREFPVFLRHEDNCGQYYVCDNGYAVWMTCPARLHFNIRKNVCDYPSAVRCRDGRLARAPAGPATGNSARESDDPSQGYAVQNSPGRKDVRCPDVNGQTPVFLGHETNCGRYYVCDTGLAILMECPHHLQFNLDKNVCDQPGNARCEIEKEEDELPEEEDEKEQEPIEYDDPADFPSNYALVHGPSIPRKDSRCPRRNGVIPTFIPHETECGKYFVCDWGYAILMHCPRTLGFDSELNVCAIGRPC